MKLYSYLQIQEIEAESLEQTGSTRAQLNEKLGAEAAAAIAEVLAECGCSPVVFAGPRRCGAIALAAARTMSLANLRPKIYFFNIRGTAAQPDTTAARDAYLEACGSDGFEEVTGIFSLPELSGRDLVVDGLFGSEIDGPLGGAYQELVRRINESGARIVSIDMPSGLPADGAPGLINRNIIHADLTLALGLPRLAFFTAENAELVGQWQTLDAGYTRACLASRDTSFNLIERRQLRRWAFPPRRADSSKADYGSLVIFAGSGGMMGAAQLATRAALRAGAGKVTCHSPRCGYNVMQTAVPEALFEIDHGDMYLRDIVLRRDYSAVAIGPGIGTHDETVDSLEQFLKVANANSRAVVLDADALNCIAIRPAMLDYIPVKSVLTPHAGEFDRIFGTHPNSAARLARAVEVAMFYKINIVLKGYHTAVVRLDGKVYYNPTGTPALATAGTGDVLTGIIGSLMAQGLSSEVAAMAGVYVHGLAGQMAEKDHGSYGVVAGDVADNVGRAINSIMN
ncbi:MAG: NAD(P)H-hydrate dehydratase [Muribaculaceae bacterium]|nr:NAD(P)H-hydrate dehydratase [Muribaculaceae bacterium]